jgi:transcription initiation factor IIE alpha subunit
MKKSIAIIIGLLFTGTLIYAQEKAGKKDTTTHTSFYSCRMHPDIRMDKAGNCPTCGMKLELSAKEAMKREVTKAYTCPVHANVISGKAGKCPKCGAKLNLSPKEKMKAEVVKIYTCPMHPDAKSEKPGKCPQCGMDLAEKK